MDERRGEPPGCIARGNPYDVALEIAEEHKTGWYLFNLTIQGYWGEIQGLFYPDGTIRAPAIIAAVMGFYRNRDLGKIIFWRVHSPETRDRDAIRTFAYELGLTLKKYCLLY